MGLLAAFVLLLLMPAVAARLSDWLWYREIGFERVFLTKIVAQWTLGGIAAVIAFAVFYGNVRLALRAHTVAVVGLASQPRRRSTPSFSERFARLFALPATGVLALLFSFGAET